MTLLRRMLLLLTLMFWQGGFTFYGGVVVPVGSAILGSDREQGFITRSVTNYLNLAGAVALAACGWDLASDRGPARRSRWMLWGSLGLTLGLLAWLHPSLDRQLDPEGYRVLDRPLFRSLHRRYLTISTVQWAGSILLLALTVRAWMVEDRRAGGRPDAIALVGGPRPSPI